jgi:CBS domain-containing protein
MAHTSSKQIVTPDTSALAALDLFQQTHLPTLFVVENEHLVGILTTQDLFKLISLKVELEGGGRGS